MSKQLNSPKKSILSLGILVLVILLLVLLAWLIWWLKPKSTPEISQISPSSMVNSIGQQTEHQPPSPLSNLMENKQDSVFESLPPSLQGTQVDGEIIIDEHKNLVVTTGLRQLFDYFLTAQGEESLTHIYQRIKQYVEQRTPEPANRQVMQLYQQYMDYLYAISLLQKKYPMSLNSPQKNHIDLQKISEHQLAIQQLRQQHFDAETIQAFFGEEDALLSYNLALLQIHQDNKLSSTEKQQMSEQAQAVYLSSLTNPKLKAQLTEQANIEKLLQQTEQMKLQGASPDEINAMRRQYVSEDAVQRLAKLDEQEMEFAERFKRYQQQRDDILQHTTDSHQAQQDIKILQQQIFSSTEINRLAGYEALQKQ